MLNGFVAQADAISSEAPAPLRGYSVIQAEDRDEVLRLLRDHPFLAGGHEYTIEVFEVPRK